jgi:hypothetical protein
MRAMGVMGAMREVWRQVAIAGSLMVTATVLGWAIHGAAAQEVAPWTLEVSDRLELAPGHVGAIQITLRGRDRFVVARNGLLIDLVPSGRGISVRQRRYQRGDAIDAEADAPAFSIPVRAEMVGDYSLEVRVRFWICTAKICEPVDTRRVTAVTVREPVAVMDAGPVSASDAASGDGPAKPRPRKRR